METVYVGRLVNLPGDEQLEEFQPGFLAVADSGEICDYGKWDRRAKRRWAGAGIVRFGEALIMPGLVDTHLHLPQMHMRGMYGADLLQWLRDYILPAEAQFSHEAFARRMAREFFAELVRNGTTLAMVYSSVHQAATDAAFREAARIGIRAIIGKVMMDRNAPAALQEKTADSLNASLALYDRWQGHDHDRLQYAFAPRFAPSCSERLMRMVGETAQRLGAYVTTHLAETLPELELTRRLFPGYRSYTDLYYRLGLLGPRTVMAHCIHLDSREYHLLARTRTKVAHCPSANLFLHSGNMDLRRMEREAITIGLGTDVGAGPSFSLFTVTQNMYFLRKMTPVKAFYLATLGGARALCLDKVTGSFQPGKEADFIVVDCARLIARPRPNGPCRAMPMIELLAQLMFRGDERLIKASFVRGKCVYRAVATGG